MGHRHHVSHFMNQHAFDRHLRICNAYPSAVGLDVFRGHKLRLTAEDGTMPYKSCRDFTVPLRVGDKINFKLGDHSAGIFALQTLPDDDAVLLLVAQRHDTVSTAVSFTSHVFANHPDAQVAVIDAYRGSAQATASIVDKRPDAEVVKSQQLKYNSLVSLGEGLYSVNLTSSDGGNVQSSQLVALGRESYVILRTGVEAEEGDVFPEELVVYPKSTEEELRRRLNPVGAGNDKGGAPVRQWFSSACAVLVLALALAAL